jgi:hypothetical protein
MSIEKNKRRAKAIFANEGKEKRERRNQRIMDYIEHKMLKGHTREQASFMAQELIDNQG